MKINVDFASDEDHVFLKFFSISLVPSIELEH